jgi:hypothetical protein
VLLVVPASTHETLASGGTAPSSRSQVASFCPTVSDRRFIDITIEQYAGSHRDLEWSFREADDSPDLLDA